MSNVFQDIMPDDELPEDVRQQTLSNLYSLRLVLDVMDLFVIKAGAAFGEVIASSSPPRSTDSADPSTEG
jgi:hypothetical protein